MNKLKYLLFILFFLNALSRLGFTAPPIVTITKPADSKTFELGQFIYFEGNAHDPDAQEIPIIENSLTWNSSEKGALGNGQNLTRSDLGVGTHTITLTVKNEAGETASAQIKITIVNTPPTVNILSPEKEEKYNANNKITFQGNASDGDTSLPDKYLKWTSDIDGSIGTGANFQVSTLSPGSHKITLTVTDPGGETTQESVTIEVINTKPVAIIKSPDDNSEFTSQDTILFQGWGEDAEEPDIQNETLIWVSNLDGKFGIGPLVYTDKLSPGTHKISLTVKDSSGFLSDPTQITIEITNEGPLPIISSPLNNKIFNENESIVFSGNASDKEDGYITGAGLEWFSDIGGFIGTGTEIKPRNLSPGNHTITLKATDSDGFENSTSITIVTGNKYPVPEIISPKNNTVFDEKELVELSGKAKDYEDGMIPGTALEWNSSRDGYLGTGEVIFNPNLSAGIHTISLKATDSYGASATTETTIIYGNTPPIAKILKPDKSLPDFPDYPEYERGEDVVFHGIGIDMEDGDLPPENLFWSSDLNGEITKLGNGNSFKLNNLKSGTHLIKLTVKDSGNSKGKDEVKIIIKEMFPDKNLIYIRKGSTDVFEIYGGIPPFKTSSRRADIASTSVLGRTVTVTGKLKGESEIFVTDKNTINTFSIIAKVFDNNISFPHAKGFMTKNNLKTNLAYEGDNLVLDASESNDDKGIISWHWEVINGNPPVYLSRKNSKKAKFVAPPVKGNEKYTAILKIKNIDQAESKHIFDFIIREKNDQFDSLGIIPVESGEKSNFYGIKYIEGLSQVKIKTPGSDPRNRPHKIFYNLLDIEKHLEDDETAAQLIIHLPERALDNQKWYQENSAKGWQEMTDSNTPLTNGAYFNHSKDQVFINIEDNGIYDLNPNKKIIRTVSGLGSNLEAETKEESSSKSNNSSSSCFINSFF
ncbi:MAG: hypothetical protein RBR53_01175 [Desulforegulaceae bacterium]|nr:hypothetical protein [Desulforegulaceae bacterium]